MQALSHTDSFVGATYYSCPLSRLLGAPEIVAQILSYLNTSDLLNLTTTFRALHSIAQDELYRTSSICRDSQAQRFIACLSDAIYIHPASVRSLCLKKVGKRRILSILRLCVGLRDLELDCSCLLKVEQEEIVAFLASSAPSCSPSSNGADPSTTGKELRRLTLVQAQESTLLLFLQTQRSLRALNMKEISVSGRHLFEGESEDHADAPPLIHDLPDDRVRVTPRTSRRLQSSTPPDTLRTLNLNRMLITSASKPIANILVTASSQLDSLSIYPHPHVYPPFPVGIVDRCSFVHLQHLSLSHLTTTTIRDILKTTKSLRTLYLFWPIFDMDPVRFFSSFPDTLQHIDVRGLPSQQSLEAVLDLLRCTPMQHEKPAHLVHLSQLPTITVQGNTVGQERLRDIRKEALDACSERGIGWTQKQLDLFFTEKYYFDWQFTQT